MKIILVMVSSVDGKTTKWNESNIHGWSSPEDSAHLSSLKASCNLLVMGRITYEEVKPHITLTDKLLRIVMTKRPENFRQDAVAGQLEFTDESPTALVTRMEQAGYNTMLLVGGSEVNELFLREQLISECIITIEPRFLGNGKGIFRPTDIDIPLKLKNIKQLNEQGTLVLHYTVSYDNQPDTN